MFAMWTQFGILLLACVYLGVVGAPFNSEGNLGTDLELNAGFFEGDMDIKYTPDGKLQPTQRWPLATVYYKIDKKKFTAHQEKFIQLGMWNIEMVSCITFEPAPKEIRDYLLITDSKTGCSSTVGYSKHNTTVKLVPNSIGKGCFSLGTIQHELLHTLGFFHQHNYADRDDYVKIVKDNISTGKLVNFQKYAADSLGNFGAPYDYESIMHYPSNAFTKNGGETIIARQPDGQSKMGQRDGLSSADVTRLNNMYNCPMLKPEIN
ncbi:seminal metalloprotease 1-like [Drosophila novamexicana]|uniref:seminal metalloprotease 1-like n=1 Tax=Drosophila novamexicana TaxID=47314 RepID=UPI0011E5F36B|nr:seminal metalloprotease 1-like [Drosophila novamexicana]